MLLDWRSMFWKKSVDETAQVAGMHTFHVTLSTQYELFFSEMYYMFVSDLFSCKNVFVLFASIAACACTCWIGLTITDTCALFSICSGKVFLTSWQVSWLCVIKCLLQVQTSSLCWFQEKSLFNLFCVLQKDNHYQPYPLEHVRHISYQLCQSVKCK